MNRSVVDVGASPIRRESSVWNVSEQAKWTDTISGLVDELFTTGFNFYLDQNKVCKIGI